MVQTCGEMHNVHRTMFSDVNQEAEKEGKKGFSTGHEGLSGDEGSTGKRQSIWRYTYIVNADDIENLPTF